MIEGVRFFMVDIFLFVLMEVIFCLFLDSIQYLRLYYSLEIVQIGVYSLEFYSNKLEINKNS